MPLEADCLLGWLSQIVDLEVSRSHNGPICQQTNSYYLGYFNKGFIMFNKAFPPLGNLRQMTSNPFIYHNIWKRTNLPQIPFWNVKFKILNGRFCYHSDLLQDDCKFLQLFLVNSFNNHHFSLSSDFPCANYLSAGPKISVACEPPPSISPCPDLSY